MTYYYEGNDARTEKLLAEAAAKSPRSLFGVWTGQYADTLHMLERIAECRSEGEKAIELCQKALQDIGAYRSWRTERADVLNQLGGFQFRQGRFVEARAAYEEAMRLRRETATQTHPNYADSLKALADMASSQGDLTGAAALARQALEVLDASVVPTHPRTAQVLVALDALETLTVQQARPVPLRQRLDTILEQPLGIWKEDFLLTVDFYAGLLQKAGKTAEAKRLRALHSREKARK